MIDDAEIEEIRKRKLAELQQAQEAEVQRQQQESQVKSQIEGALRPLLTPDAWDQWCTARIGNENNAYVTALTVIQTSRAGKLHRKLNKEQIRAILSEVGKHTRKEWKITRK